jgi:hypothetical protein
VQALEHGLLALAAEVLHHLARGLSRCAVVERDAIELLAREHGQPAFARCQRDLLALYQTSAITSKLKPFVNGERSPKNNTGAFHF